MANSPDRNENQRNPSEDSRPLVPRRIDSMLSEPRILGAVGGILASGTIEGILNNLILPERIASLLALESRIGKAKYAELIALHKISQQSQGDDLMHEDISKLTAGEKAEQIRKVSNLRTGGVDRAIAEAEVRLRYNGFDPYPDSFDDDVWAAAEQERQGFRPYDGLPRFINGRLASYPEAVRFAKTTNAKRFYSSYYYPAITREEEKGRQPITRATLQTALTEYNKAYPNQPGGTITLESLLDGVYAMLDRNAENTEACHWHNRVKELILQIMDQRNKEQNGK